MEEISYIDEEYLAHHGILGQKWGVRRYQNKDGSLTDQGRMRYSDAENAYKDRLKFGKLRPEDREYLAKTWKEQENWDKTLSKYEPKPGIIKKTINYADELVSTSVKSPEVIKSLINLGAEILKQNNKKEKEKKKEDSRNKSNEAKEKAKRMAAAEEIVEGLEEDEAKHSLLDDPEAYLAHHGILGQKWGIRRYQNKDGSLTEEGRRRRLQEFSKAAYKYQEGVNGTLAKYLDSELGKQLADDIYPAYNEWRGYINGDQYEAMEIAQMEFEEKAYEYYYKNEKGIKERELMEQKAGRKFFVDPVDGNIDGQLVDEFSETNEGKQLEKELGFKDYFEKEQQAYDNYTRALEDTLKKTGIYDLPVMSDKNNGKYGLSVGEIFVRDLVSHSRLPLIKS